MSNPAAAEARSSDSNNAAATEPTFEQNVNEAAKQLTKDDKGIWQFPDDFEGSSEVKFAATLEKRRRDTESAYGSTRLELKTEKGLREKLEQRVAEQVILKMTPEAATELETLKDNDPDAWRLKVNDLEREARSELTQELAADRTTVSQEAEIERRETVLTQFNEEHPDAPITDEMLDKDIPPRITKKLESGTITFEEFLTEAHGFMTRKVVVKGTTLEEEPNLGDVGGGSDATDAAKSKQDVDDYSKTTF